MTPAIKALHTTGVPPKGGSPGGRHPFWHTDPGPEVTPGLGPRAREDQLSFASLFVSFGVLFLRHAQRHHGAPTVRRASHAFRYDSGRTVESPSSSRLCVLPRRSKGAGPVPVASVVGRLSYYTQMNHRADCPYGRPEIGCVVKDCGMTQHHSPRGMTQHHSLPRPAAVLRILDHSLGRKRPRRDPISCGAGTSHGASSV